MSSLPSVDSASGTGATLRHRSSVLDRIARIDDGVYAVERTVVTAAMLIMSGVVCLNVLYQFLTAQRVALQQFAAGDAALSGIWGVPLALIVAAAITHAAISRAPSCRGNTPVIVALTAVVLLALAALCVLMVMAPSRVVVAGLTVLCGVVTAFTVLDRPTPVGRPAFGLGEKLALAQVAFATAVLTGLAATSVPAGYTWAQKLALFLLLWVAFIGASMATHDGRHLTVDAVRKLMPPRLQPYYNGVSDLIAAIFTAGFAYLAIGYFFDRYEESAAPGEIPDWLKVLSIPVSLSIVTLRFFGRSIAHFLTGIWGLTPAGAADTENQ